MDDDKRGGHVIGNEGEVGVYREANAESWPCRAGGIVARATVGRGMGVHRQPARVRAEIEGPEGNGAARKSAAGCARDRMRFRGHGALTREEATAEGTRELSIVLDGYDAGKSMREIAVDLYGAEKVTAEWTSDSVLRTRMRRLLRKARANSKRG